MPTKLRAVVLALIAVVTTAFGTLAAASVPAAAGPLGRQDRYDHDCPTACTLYGAPLALGRGTARTYVRITAARPAELGVVIDAAAVASLPHSPPTDGRHCFDVDGDGAINPMTECVGGYALALTLPHHAPEPYRWVLLNWNPAGHPPAGMYGVPHFDAHFYVEPRATIKAIRPGRCALLVDCAQLPAIAAPLPDRYVPQGYPATLPATAEVGMGEHLDADAGFQNGATFIYGAVAGSLVFLEPMVRQDALAGSPPTVATTDNQSCLPVPQPQAWQRAGWYPSEYCFGRSATGDYRVGLDQLTYHDAG